MSAPTQREVLAAMLDRAIEASQVEARQMRRARKERIRRQERLVWLITVVLFGFIAIALFCGPAANL